MVRNTLDYLAFQNQYSFNGQKDCDDLVKDASIPSI